jgi:hypothetical protein
MIAIIEPILAGLTVSIINKYIVNNPQLWFWCTPPPPTRYEHEDDLSSSNTTVSDISLDNPHIHVHT